MGRFRGLDVGNIELKDVNFSHLPKLKRFVKPFRWYLLLALALAVAISLLSTVGPPSCAARHRRGHSFRGFQPIVQNGVNLLGDHVPH